MSDREKDLRTMAAMVQHGGSFAAALGRAAQLADQDNLETIKEAFPELWDSYKRKGGET